MQRAALHRGDPVLLFVVHFLLDGNKLTALLKEEESRADAEVKAAAEKRAAAEAKAADDKRQDEIDKAAFLAKEKATWSDE